MASKPWYAAKPLVLTGRQVKEDSIEASGLATLQQSAISASVPSVPVAGFAL